MTPFLLGELHRLRGAGLNRVRLVAVDRDVAPGQVTDLGVAMSSINVRLSTAGEFAGGTPVGYLLSDGNPVSLEVVDQCSEGLLDQHRMEPYPAAASFAEDGAVFLNVRGPHEGTHWR